MATFIVDTLADTIDAADGKTSLREALTAANAQANADKITFAAGLEGKTLVLTRNQLEITSDVTITGDPDGDRVGITIDQRTDHPGAEVSARVLAIGGDGTNVVLSGMTITGGRPIAATMHVGVIRRVPASRSSTTRRYHLLGAPSVTTMDPALEKASPVPVAEFHLSGGA